ncbi:MAG: hypothetical protein V4546_08995 [Bacteroidota bacterium]
MRKFILFAILILGITTAKAQMGGVMEYKPVTQPIQSSATYYGKYTLGNDKLWYSDSFTLTITSKQIIYTKNGNAKYLDMVNNGVYTRKDNGIEFRYQKYYLSNKDIYMLISKTKEIKHNGTFYYRIIIDGQTQLAL